MILSPRSLLFWSSVACCLVAQVLIVRSVLGARTLPAPRPELTRSRGAVEVLWAVAPAVALGVLLWFTWQAIRQREALDVRASAPAMEASR
jgi:heme/copper-type cytochrome/quinol oxidase subunit 2